jgi:hypothetical protein
MAEKEDLQQTCGIREKTVTDFDSVLFMKRKAKARTEEQMRIVAIEISGGRGMVMNLTEAEVKEVTGATATVMKIVREEETGVTETDGMNMMVVIVNEGTGIDLGLDHSLGTGKGTLRLSFSLISCAHICNIIGGCMPGKGFHRCFCLWPSHILKW